MQERYLASVAHAACQQIQQPSGEAKVCRDDGEVVDDVDGVDDIDDDEDDDDEDEDEEDGGMNIYIYTYTENNRML